MSRVFQQPTFDVAGSGMAGGMAILLAALVGIGVGVAVVLASPVGALAAVAGVGIAVAVALRPVVGLHALVAVASLAPFGVIPVSFGVQLTFVDGLLGAVMLGWLARAATGRASLELTLPGRFLLIFLAVALAALLAGSAYAPLSGPVLRAFLKYAVATALLLAVVNLARETAQVRRLVGTLMLCGGVAAVLALAIHSLPRFTIVEVLSSLSVIGYPTGSGVLRFLPAPNNTYSDVLRATGTSIDPNVLGGMLMLAGALMAGQWFDAGRALPRPVLGVLLVPTLMAMAASHSRGSWVGLAVATAFLATFRYRRLWLLAVPAVLALLYLPGGQEMLDRLASGFAFRDRAAALRLDEYQQAIRLITAYPLLGVGFGGSPEAGTFVGVSNIYLLVGEHTGLVGLALYLAAIGSIFVYATRASRAAPSDQRGLLVTLQAAFVAALTVGLVDHYFMNPQFPHMVALFWLYAGLLLAASRLARGVRPRPGPCAEPRA
jgi:polysaccharide biosynthesis protein PslJ